MSYHKNSIAATAGPEWLLRAAASVRLGDVAGLIGLVGICAFLACLPVILDLPRADVSIETEAGE